MKVFFSCSTRDILKYKSEYRAIRQALLDKGHTLTRDWLERSISYAKTKAGDIPRADIYPQIIGAILAADVVILEGTVRSTSVGYQLAFALRKAKPVLLLSNDSQEKLEKSFIGGAKSQLLTVNSYNKNNVQQIVEHYLTNATGGPRVRFNLVMNKKQNNYLEWASFSYKKSKTKVICESIDKKIQEDKRYRKFLGDQGSPS